MPTYAVAIVYEDFPRYDHAKREGQSIHYYFKDAEVFCIDYGKPQEAQAQKEGIPSFLLQPGQILEFGKHLSLNFIKAETPEDAHKKVEESIPYHVLMVAVSECPRELDS
jgi:autonomous glycyl radical cofactor GrcA